MRPVRGNRISKVNPTIGRCFSRGYKQLVERVTPHGRILRSEVGADLTNVSVPDRVG